MFSIYFYNIFHNAAHAHNNTFQSCWTSLSINWANYLSPSINAIHGQYYYCTIILKVKEDRYQTNNIRLHPHNKLKNDSLQPTWFTMYSFLPYLYGMSSLFLTDWWYFWKRLTKCLQLRRLKQGSVLVREQTTWPTGWARGKVCLGFLAFQSSLDITVRDISVFLSSETANVTEMCSCISIKVC